MATLATANIEVMLAMEELGLSGWLSGPRVKVRVPRERTRRAREIAITSNTSSKELARTVGLALVAASAAAWAANTGETRPAGVPGGRVLGTLLAGIGVVAACALLAVRRAR